VDDDLWCRIMIIIILRNNLFGLCDKAGIFLAQPGLIICYTYLYCATQFEYNSLILNVKHAISQIKLGYDDFFAVFDEDHKILIRI